MGLLSASLTPLRHRTFATIWFANIFSNFGSLIQSVGAAWLMATMTDSTRLVALVQSSASLPIMFLALASGAIADNFERRHVMLVAQCWMASVSVALAILSWRGAVVPWLLLVFTFSIGCGQALNAPAWQASVREQVPREDLTAAVSLNALGFNLARSLGPALGGVIVAAAGAATAFAINAVSYFAVIFALLGWRRENRPDQLPRETVLAAMLAGLRYAAMSTHLRTVLLRGLTLGLAASAISALMPMIARILLGGGPLTFGLLSGAFGVGAVAGALLNAPMRHRTGPEAVFRLGVIAFAASAAVAAVSRWPILTLVAMIFGGVGWVTTLSTLTVTIQMSTPRWVVARALAIYQMTTFGGMGIGSWLWGSLAEQEGLRTALAISAGALVVISLLGLRFPLCEPDEASVEPWPVRDRPAPALDIENRSGPIVTTVEYRIRPEDRAAFARAMLQLRRIRLRDGARDWSLMQDLADPFRWVERFHSPTWADHLRRRTRLTQADREGSEIARSFHHGEAPPLVSVLIGRPRNALAAIGDERRTIEDAPLTEPGLIP